jgi:two-component system, cell cycle response regulator CpdR
MAHILLADDDAAARDLVKRALELDGHSVQMAGDGAEAIAAFDASVARPFDLIITDVEMPGTDASHWPSTHSRPAEKSKC